DPAVVCADADLEVAAKAIAIGRFFNAGQACLAIKRVFVVEAVADQLIEKVVARAKKLKVAQGQDPASQMGPMHTRGGREEIEGEWKDAIDRLAAGYTWVNRIQVAYDALPSGGTQHSGFGKEHGTEVLDFYTEQKRVVMAGV